LKKGTKSSTSTSQIVRDFAANNPTLKASEIIKELTAQGHKVYPALVSQALRGSADGKKPGKKRGRKPGTKNKVVAAAKTAKSAKAANTDTSFGNLKAAADFIRSSGSAESALQAIRDYQKIAALING
jgi:hypothetical protein